MKIYYGHPMSWYDTAEELDDVRAIGDFGPQIEVVNPNTPEFKALVDGVIGAAGDGPYPGSAIMKIFYDAVSDCDAIAYRTFNDGYLGAGVAGEIFQAAIKGKIIYQIMNAKNGPMLFEQQGLRTSFGPRVLTIVETRDRIKRRVM